MSEHLCPKGHPTEYQRFSGGQEWYCRTCDENGRYEEARVNPYGVEENLRWLLGASLDMRVAVVSRDRIATVELTLNDLDEAPEPWHGDLAVVLEAARAWAEDHGYGP